MGQTQSQSEMQNNLAPLLKNIHSPPYGDIQIHSNQSDYYAFKPYIFQSEEAWQLFKVQSDKILQSNYLVQMLDFQYQQQSQLCSTLYKAYKIYPYYETTLSDQINSQKQFFEETSITHMLYCVANALLLLKSLGKSHGNLRPQTILATSQHYKLTDIQDLTNETAYSHLVSCLTADYNVTPEELESLQNKILKPKYDIYKADIFSLGLTVLEMCSLESIQNIYDYERLVINQEELDNIIERVSHQYSTHLLLLIKQMIQINPEDRPDLQTILNRVNIIKYESPPKKIRHHKSEVSASSIEEIDLKVREAIQKSKYAQMKYKEKNEQRQALHPIKNQEFPKIEQDQYSYQKKSEQNKQKKQQKNTSLRSKIK